MSEKIKKGFNILLAIIVTIFAFYVAKYLRTSINQEKAVTQISSTIETELNRAREQSTSEKTTSDIMDEYADRVRKESLASKTGQSRAVAAASQILGAHHRAMLTVQYCQNLGVSMNKFEYTYRTDNSQLYQKAYNIVKEDSSKNGYNLQSMLTDMNPTFNKLVKQDMEDTSSAYKMTEYEICSAFESFPNETSKEIRLNVMVPEAVNIVRTY